MVPPPHETADLAKAFDGKFSPELLFGIGGGTGFGWFTYGDPSTLLTRITTRETPKESFLLDICTRLGVDARLAAAGGAPALRKRIDAAKAAGDTVLLAVGGPAVSYSATLVDQVTGDLLTRAAALPGAARNRILVIPREHDVSATALHSAIRAGLRAHIDQMRDGFGPPSTRGSFGLAGFERWRRSAPSLDANARDRLREQIERRGGGPALRAAHATFLDQAGLKRAAELTRQSADAWSAVIEEPTPERVTTIEEAERAAIDAIETSDLMKEKAT